MAMFDFRAGVLVLVLVLVFEIVFRKIPSTEDDSSTPTSIFRLRIAPASGEDEGLTA